MSFIHETTGVIDHGECTQPKKVHLQHAELQQAFIVELRGDNVLGAFGERHVLCADRALRDDDAGGVNTGVALQAFETFGGDQQLFSIRRIAFAFLEASSGTFLRAI